MHIPNLFDYATSELSQDAFICWLLAWAKPENVSASSGLHRVGSNFLRAIFTKTGKSLPQRISSVEVKPQEDDIDVFCIVNGDTAIVIEDKVGTIQHSDQLSRYNKIALERGYTADKIISVYLQTGDQSDYSEVEKNGYTVFKRLDFLAVLESQEGKLASQGSDILAAFSRKLRTSEDKVQSYLTLKLDNWGWESWQGFYTKIQEILRTGTWRYVSNESGGFLAFYWNTQTDKECNQYLLLNSKSHELYYKIAVPDEAKRRALRDLWHHRVMEHSQKNGIILKKPGKYGSGNDMTVAVLDQNDFRVADKNGILNIEATISILQKAGSVLAECISTPIT